MIDLSHLQKRLKKVSHLEAVDRSVLLILDTSSVCAAHFWAASPLKGSVHAEHTEQDEP